MDDLVSWLKDPRSEGFSQSTSGRGLEMVLWERVIPFVCSTRDAGNLLSSTSHQSLSPHGEVQGTRAG